MERIKLERVVVELEDAGNGQKRLKRLKNGLKPMDVLAELISEENDAFRREYNRDGYDWVVYDEPGEPGERPHLIFVLMDKTAGEDERKPKRRFVLWDKDTDKPVPIPLKIPNKPGMRTMDRADTLEHVGNFLDFTKLRAKAEARGLEIQHAESWHALEKAARRMEV